MSARIPSSSKEYLRARWSGKSANGTLNPSAFPVQAALMPAGVEPAESDWKTAQWDVGGTRYYVKVLVGPGTDIPTVEGNYQLWSRVNYSPEAIVRSHGVVVVT